MIRLLYHQTHPMTFRSPNNRNYRFWDVRVYEGVDADGMEIMEEDLPYLLAFKKAACCGRASRPIFEVV